MRTQCSMVVDTTCFTDSFLRLLVVTHDSGIQHQACNDNSVFRLDCSKGQLPSLIQSSQLALALSEGQWSSWSDLVLSSFHVEAILLTTTYFLQTVSSQLSILNILKDICFRLILPNCRTGPRLNPTSFLECPKPSSVCPSNDCEALTDFHRQGHFKMIQVCSRDSGSHNLWRHTWQGSLCRCDKAESTIW